jgi:hypothetical protein
VTACAATTPTTKAAATISQRVMPEVSRAGPYHDQAVPPHFPFLEHTPALAPDGAPLHRRGVSTTVPGLGYVGLEYQCSFASATVRGVARDAHHVLTPLSAANRPATSRQPQTIIRGKTAARHPVSQRRPPDAPAAVAQPGVRTHRHETTAWEDQQAPAASHRLLLAPASVESSNSALTARVHAMGARDGMEVRQRGG